jgi:hypothetical protein
MRANADLLSGFRSAHVKVDASTVNPCNLRLAGNLPTDRRGREMADIDHRADRTLARIAFSAAFSMIMIITGVAKTGGSIASLNWFARCCGWTSKVNEPLAPIGIGFMAHPFRQC